MTIILLLISLLLALGVAYYALQWWTASVEDRFRTLWKKLQQLDATIDIEDPTTDIDIEKEVKDLKDDITKYKSETDQAISQTKTTIASSSGAKVAALTKLLALNQEVQTLLATVQTTADLARQDYGMGDYAYAGAVGLVAWLLFYYLFRKLLATTSQSEN